MAEKISRRDFICGALGAAATLATPGLLTSKQEDKKTLKVTVCELNNDDGNFSKEWEQLAAHVKTEKSDLVLLPELVFAPWVAFEQKFDQKVWQVAVNVHNEWKGRLKELAPAIVLGSGPVNSGNKRFNEAFVWESSIGYKPVHQKRYLPNHMRFWEAMWTTRGEDGFKPFQSSKALIGFMICTDLWFFQHSRNYGKMGAHIIANPRATSNRTVERWVVGGRTTSIVSGAYCLSSNRVSKGKKSGWSMGGTGWITAPGGGAVMGLTSREQPFLTKEIDINRAERAKKAYPLNVVD